MRSTTAPKWAAVLFVFAMLLAACGGGGAPQSGGGESEAPDAAGESEAAEGGASEAAGEGGLPPGRPEGEPSVITAAGSPDHILDYLRDTGRLEELEEEWNVKLEMTETWDELTFFAGGHGQVVSTGTYDLPALEAETGVDTVTFGKYNVNRLPVLVKADSPYQTLSDLKGKKVAVGSVASSTLIWGTLAAEIEGANFTFDGDEYDVVLSDHAVNPELVARGEADACICIPEFAVPQLRKGELRALYDGAAPWELWQQEINPDHKGIMSNVFVAEAEWFNSHPYEVQFFLNLWEEGLKLWEADKAKIIAEYPQHFSVEAPEDVEFMQNYLEEHDWFVDTVYLDQEWIDGELQLYDLMQEHGFMEEIEGDLPEFRAVENEVAS